ncbi:MAG TPA: DivIVA domain-containing protein [Actinomycetes bacterium]|nr:DivIVA domain-containing protein [Actinomycetes bacterium]
MISQHDRCRGDSQETLARLGSSGGGPTKFRLHRGGYDIAEVDAFLAIVESRTVAELEQALFNAASRSKGYNEDDVDQHPDEIVARRRRARDPP